MMKRIYYVISWFVALVAIGCSESLEDTYDEYTGDGVIRYLGKCSGLEVNPGWERLQVVWKNNVDAKVKRVKITWQSENESTPCVRYVDRSGEKDDANLMDTIYLEGLKDAVYTVRVCNQDVDSVESLVEEKYGRPYTENHEDLRTFTRGISAFSRMGDKLAVVIDQDNENVKELQLCYHDMNGQERAWDVKAHMTDSLFYGTTNLGRDYMYLIPEETDVKIDFSRPLFIQRKGKLNSCVDEIKFKDEELNLNEKIWSTAFTQLMLGKYGPDWESKVESLETLELDYNLNSMQDLIYFPNLKKVILGKNRYISLDNISYELMAKGFNYFSSTDEYVALVALQFLKRVHEDFSVVRYTNHYFGMDMKTYLPYVDLFKRAGKLDNDFMIEEKYEDNMRHKTVYTRLETTGWVVTCSDTLYSGYKDRGAAMLLFDGPRHFVDDYWGDEWDEEVYFEPGLTLGASIVTVNFDMKNTHTVKGFKVCQPTLDKGRATDFLLSSLKIEFSADGYNWRKATHTDGSVTIGNTPGEETFILVPEDLQGAVRYIRLTMTNRHVDEIDGHLAFNLRLGMFIPLAEIVLPD